MKFRNSIYSLLLINSAVFLSMPLTNRAQDQKSQQQPAMAIKEISVHFVEAKEMYRYRDTAYKLHESKTAYLVFMDLDNMPTKASSALNIYIGDYKIPEYGGTFTGIYFRIYDQKLLKRLDKQTIYYQIDKGEKRSLNRQFIIPQQQSMKKQTEEDVMKIKRG